MRQIALINAGKAEAEEIRRPPLQHDIQLRAMVDELATLCSRTSKT